MWATLSVGLFDRQTGIFYTQSFNQFFIQLLGAIVLIMWTVLISLAFFAILVYHKRFRVGNIYEIVGLDQMTKKSDFDDLLSMDTISKVEARQRSDETYKRKR